MTIERVRGGIGGIPEQDYSLRVTQVYRREGMSSGSCIGTPIHS